MNQTTVLIIEDEPAISDMICFACKEKNFDIRVSHNTAHARIQLKRRIPQIIILDWMLPKESGYSFLGWLRKQNTWRHIPVIMLTAKSGQDHKIKALENGADDYMTKPFSPAELIARIKTVLRRGNLQAPNNIISCGELSINIDSHRATVNNTPLKLSPNEYKLLCFFMTNPNKTHPRTMIIDQVWGPSAYLYDRTIDVHIRRLRNKLKPNHHDLIKTVRGTGYLFDYKNINGSAA